MSKPKQHQPERDFGFYATIPRIVRTDYREISPMQKWLYVCLKDLAGDDGTCYRTIRTLARETGLSAGLISESIPLLHTAGLIHAEKKKRLTGGKEVWHITIVDIWQQNGEIHPTKRSLGEPSGSAPHAHPTNVQVANDDGENGSRRECSPGETEERTPVQRESKNSAKARTEDVRRALSEASGAASASPPLTSPPDMPCQFILQRDERQDRSADEAAVRVASGYPLVLTQARSTGSDEASSAGDEKIARAPGLSTSTGTFPQVRAKASSGERAPRSKAALPARETIPLSPEAHAIFAAWCSLFTVAVPLTPAVARAAESLVKPTAAWCPALGKTPAELLKEIMNWLYATDTTGYYKRGVKLYDVSREFEGWQSVKERRMRTSIARSCIPVPTREEDPYSIAALLAEQNPGFFA